MTQQNTETTIYQQAKKLMQPDEINHHESDLYLKATPISQILIKQYDFQNNVTTFRSNIDRSLWHEIPFAYDPFWPKSSNHRETTLKTDGWTEKEIEQVEAAIFQHFSNKTLKNHRGEQVYFPRDAEKIEMILGLPYTSTSKAPMIGLDCNTHIQHPNHSGYRYDFAALDTEGNVVIVLRDTEENEKLIHV